MSNKDNTGNAGPPPDATPPQDVSAPQDENKLIAERRAKLAAIRAQGIAFPNDFRRDALAGELLDTYAKTTSEELEAAAVQVKVSGRMMLRRIMGKASFAKLQDPSGRPTYLLPAGARAIAELV